MPADYLSPRDHTCIHCGRAYTAYSELSKYCTLRCKANAADKRRRERDRQRLEARRLTEAAETKQ